MDDSDIPIDIHSGKLLDWLVSRRHVTKDWQKKIGDVREKIKHAILDMPENERIVELLKGGYINFFHAVQIIEILKETEKDSKNFLGFYSSQRMKDWQEIESLYKKDSIGLGEASQLLQRVVQYEIPALRRNIQKADQAIQDGAKKEKEYLKQSFDAKKNYDKELSRMGIKGVMLRSELLNLASELPSFIDSIALLIQKLAPAKEYYEAFRDYVHNSSAPSLSLLPLLTLIFTHGSSVTVYEYTYGKAPVKIEKPSIELLIKADENKEEAEDEIDFGDDLDLDLGETGGEIDFGDGQISIDVVADERGLVLEDGVARGDEALGLLENGETRQGIKEELEELISFLSARSLDEDTEGSADIFILGSEVRPDKIRNVTVSQLKEWNSQASSILAELNNPQKIHLFKIRTSPQYVETLVDELIGKRDLEGRYEKMAKLMEDKQKREQDNLRETRNQLNLTIENTKKLKKEVEEEISKKYKGRQVNIMGGIHQALVPI
ncbi:cdkr-3 [Pristionchus pacificus]|nr:cdkr-3 [Pristionchus pacificus]